MRLNDAPLPQRLAVPQRDTDANSARFGVCAVLLVLGCAHDAPTLVALGMLAAPLATTDLATAWSAGRRSLEAHLASAARFVAVAVAIVCLGAAGTALLDLERGTASAVVPQLAPWALCALAGLAAVLAGGFCAAARPGWAVIAAACADACVAAPLVEAGRVAITDAALGPQELQALALLALGTASVCAGAFLAAHAVVTGARRRSAAGAVGAEEAERCGR